MLALALALTQVMIPMRDGVRLATDVYTPGITASSRYPVILERTPYNKATLVAQGRDYASKGYVYAVQDVRGRFKSDGIFEPFRNEGKDGYDTIEWLAAQPWCTGKIGMIGGSYDGLTQWHAAAEKPPHLVTIIPNVAPPGPFQNAPYDHGILFSSAMLTWLQIIEDQSPLEDSPAHSLARLDQAKLLRSVASLPVADMDLRLFGRRIPAWRHWIEGPFDSGYWKPMHFASKLRGVDIPVFHQSGWFDDDGIGSKLNYERLRSLGHRKQKLILGPWGHTARSTRTERGRDFGEAAELDLAAEYLRWFDALLKGEGQPDYQTKLFVMGENRWLAGPEYPLPQTRFERFYLAPGGRLSRIPVKDAKPGTYTFDPGRPTPSPRALGEPAGRRHWQMAHKRADILTYSTGPLTKPMTIAGPMSAVIHAASTAADTDFFVRISEEDPAAGTAFLLAEGKVRARYRHSMTTPELLEPGRVYPFEIDLWQTAITIPVGKALMVEVASASFPLFAPNLNTGRDNNRETKHQKASQTIHYAGRRASYVELPVIDRPAVSSSQ